MTKMEVMEWMTTQSFDEVIEFVIIADDWEHSQPELNMPDAYAILDDEGNLYVKFEGHVSVVVGTVSPLQYQWEIPDAVFEEFYVEKKRRIWPWLAVGGGSVLAGVIIGLLIN